MANEALALNARQTLITEVSDAYFSVLYEREVLQAAESAQHAYRRQLDQAQAADDLAPIAWRSRMRAARHANARASADSKVKSQRMPGANSRTTSSSRAVSADCRPGAHASPRASVARAVGDR